MRMAIRYLMTYTYDAEVTESHNALRAKPADNERQKLISYTVSVDPSARIYSYEDYWGTQVDSFGVIGRHSRLTIVADSVVETSSAAEPTADGGWPPAAASESPDVEYLAVTPHVEWTDEITEYGRELTRDARSILDAVRAVQGGVGDRLQYVSGSTEVGITVDEVFQQGQGVCQDYAHLALAVYRSLAIPARYVSGYLYAADAAAGDRPDDDEVDVSTHAWVEVAIPGFGWWGLDPTNQKVVGEQHVKIGHGRDYEDAMPLRGVYHGEAESGGLEAGVKMSRAVLDPYAMQPRPGPVRRQQQQQQQQQ